MSRVIITLFATGLFKIAPLVQSMLMIKLVGSEYYVNFGYYLILAMFSSTLFTVGIVPAYIRNITLHEENHNIETDFLRFVFVGAIFYCFIFAFIGYMGWLNEKNILVAAITGLSLGFNSMLLPILIATGSQIYVVFCSLFFLILTIIITLFSQYMSQSSFEYFYIIPPLTMMMLLSAKYFINNKETLLTGSDNTFIRSLKQTIRFIAPVFVPNVLLMGAVFFFGHRVSLISDNPDLFSWYTVSFQLFAVFVFIPNSIAPLILAKMSKSTSSESFALSYIIAFQLVLLALVLFMLFLMVYFWDPLNMFEIPAIKTIAIICFAGVFASGIAPLNNFLVREHKAQWMICAVFVWSLVAHLGLTFIPNLYDWAFLFAHLCSFITMLIVVFLANPLHGKI